MNLNIGDGRGYAFAKASGEPLLFKGSALSLEQISPQGVTSEGRSRFTGLFALPRTSSETP